ncbi:anti-sigma regulatory factor (Ser/Thr protein kinase) [Streptomyces sp. CEV 2-1]|uniref:ATP-binding protein n=1 Tax=Streptomyces sp. NBC_01260 TaxID=2903801 RepID=UPI000F468916|nr:anti-sigma regulatory factor (Ser/Thr protein kinase) [Streptomyces sp. CEV 2-1]
MNQALPQPAQPVRTFSQLLSSTPRGARLARLLTVTELQSWDAPPDLTERAELVVAELAANAVLHGRVPGRDFRLALAYAPPTEHLRIEVTDARGDRRPELPPYEPASLGDGGRGLLLVDALADHWDCAPYPPSGKTVRAELSSARSVSAPPRPTEAVEATGCVAEHISGTWGAQTLPLTHLFSPGSAGPSTGPASLLPRTL